MGPKPKRFQQQRCLHFITFSCYRRMALLDSAAARELFERGLERVRRWYGCYLTGYVVMPEHVHLLISEPKRGTLSVVIQMLKQITSRKLRAADTRRFWQVRYYGFPVWSERKPVEKLRYIHRKSGEARSGRETRGLALEQFPSVGPQVVKGESRSNARQLPLDGSGWECR